MKIFYSLEKNIAEYHDTKNNDECRLGYRVLIVESGGSGHKKNQSKKRLIINLLNFNALLGVIDEFIS